MYAAWRNHRRASFKRGTYFGFSALHPQPDNRILLFLPSRDVVELPISPDDAVKLIVSCGVIQPDPTRLSPKPAESSVSPRRRPRGLPKPIGADERASSKNDRGRRWDSRLTGSKSARKGEQLFRDML
jgi:hypothetical protein